MIVQMKPSDFAPQHNFKGYRQHRQTQSELSRSEYGFSQVISQQEFDQLSQQINLNALQRQNLLNSLYGKNSWSEREDKFTRSKVQQKKKCSPYESAFNLWKEESRQECGFKQTYANALALVDKRKRQFQMDRLLKEHNIPGAVFRYSDGNEQVSKIRELYWRQLQRLVDRSGKSIENVCPQESPESNEVRFQQKKQILGSISRSANSVSKEKMIELAVQKELLDKIKKINEEQRRAQQVIDKEKQFQKTCFLNLINRPPPLSWSRREVLQTNHLDPPNPIVCNLSERDQEIMKSQTRGVGVSRQKEHRYKLNISDVLKIPYKQFLIFYSDNYHQILGLASPEEMIRINQYRDEALQRESALQKLKQKVASYGPQRIFKLPLGAREKLFRILYEKDLAMQQYQTQ